MKDRVIICDSSSLIALSNNCLLDVLKFFSSKEVDFVIPKAVSKEIIYRPLSIQMKAYQFSAMRLKRVVDEGVLIEVDAGLTEETKMLVEAANKIFFSRGRPIHILDPGEIEMLILAKRLNADALLVDERTFRLMIEAPFRLKEHLEDELGTAVMINEKNYNYFQSFVSNIPVIRSVELLAVAYEEGFFDNYKEKKKVLEAVLYAMKYSGCAVSFSDIEKIIKLVA
jgi:predicted nucleic acid-binding protein